MYGLYLSAAGADVQSRHLEVISHNLANVDTPGFKPEMAIHKARHAEEIEQGIAAPGTGSLNDISGGVELTETRTGFGLGPFQKTGRKTDIAIQKRDVFFQVEKDGRTLLTRAGNFHVGPNGDLLTAQGFAVLSDAGTPIVIDPNKGEFRVTDDGVILQGDQKTSVGLVKPASLGDLARAGENLFAPLAEVSAANDQDRRVSAGMLEKSAVKPMLEMMRMIETSRAYESNMKLIQHHDQMIGELVNRVLRQ